jgi:hypothetical protein
MELQTISGLSVVRPQVVQVNSAFSRILSHICEASLETPQ